MTLEEIEKCMRPQFIWDRSGLKLMQTDEAMEGSKEVGRLIFVGISDMYGMSRKDVQDYLDMSYDAYRNTLTKFRELYGDSQRQKSTNKRFGIKTGLCLNAIRNTYNTTPFINLTDYVD